MTSAKFESKAADWSASAYGDAERYLSRRAAAIVTLGPPLVAGDTLLDLACGDGGLADFLPPGISYRGVDGSEAMVAAARARGREVARGDLNEYAPTAEVAATSCFRAIYYANDRRRFFAHVRSYTRKKLVFDLNPRQFRLADVRADAYAAGFTGFVATPFFVPQRYALPPPLAHVLQALERSGPVARAVLRARFTYVCAASS
jgi:SAM-dependent methyltransferase